MSGRFVRREVRDVLVAEGEAIVLLVNSRVARLSAIGTACFEVLEDPRSVEDLAAEIEDRFGAPPEGETLTAVEAVPGERRACRMATSRGGQVRP